MGQISEEIDRKDVVSAVQTLDGLGVEVQRTVNQITRIATSYRDVKALAEDDDDAAVLSARFSEVLGTAKSTIAGLDDDIKSIVTSFLGALVAE